MAGRLAAITLLLLVSVVPTAGAAPSARNLEYTKECRR
jgi:hypothetical protein